MFETPPMTLAERRRYRKRPGRRDAWIALFAAHFRPGHPGARHWRLEPTAWSRLR